MYCLIGLLLSLTLWPGGEAAGESFVSTVQNKNASEGHTVVFQCQVTPEDSTIEWWFLDHNQQISAGWQILLADLHSFSIVRPEGSEGHWNLQIAPVTKDLQGQYQCRISKTQHKQTNSLNVVDSEVVTRPPPAEIPHVDYKACCRQEGISDSCLPACNPADLSTLPDFNPVAACGNDLGILIKCGADNRNHVPCCMRRMVTVECLDWCLGKFPEVFDYTQMACLMQADSIVGCFEEGQLLLPSSPVFVQGHARSTSSIGVRWEAPQENSETVTGYKVFFRKMGDETWNSSVSQNQISYNIDNLKPLQTYEMYVAALNVHGASLPSYIVEVMTLGDEVDGPNPVANSLEVCCRNRHMSTPCVNTLCTGNYQPDSRDLMGCLSQLDHVFVCLGGEKDHTGCCRMKNIPSECLSLCSGTVVNTTFQSTHCIQYINDVNSCAQENKDSIPGPPSSVGLDYVLSTSVRVRWEEPIMNAPLVQQYMLILTDISTNTRKQYMTQERSMTISTLEAGMHYSVAIVSMGGEGNSVPSPTLRFLTYMANGGIREDPPTTQYPPTEPPPHSVSDCCVEEGVTEECRVFCSYDAEVSTDMLALAIKCGNQIGKAYQCGAGGRNHTSCCQRRGVPDMCLDYCAFGEEEADRFTLLLEHADCLSYLDRARQCMQEGVAVIPTPPQAVTVVDYSSSLIKMEWTAPVANSAQVTGYRVQYKRLDTMEMARIDTDVESALVQPLSPETEYEISVVARSANGVSLPSATVIVLTKKVQTDHTLNVTTAADFTACCRTKGVSGGCISHCSGTTSILDLDQCADQLGHILECAAAERDHSDCCMRYRVPQHCHGFCRADTSVKDFTSLLCLAYSQEIFTCFREGYDKLPYSPERFNLQEVGSRFITFAWEAPKENTENIVYELFYKKQWDADYMVIKNVSSPYKLIGLEPFTHYDVYVITLNNYGSSLPSPVLTVWTDQENKPEITIEQKPQEGYVKEKRTIKLMCKARGTPEPTKVYWILPDKSTTESNAEPSVHEIKEVMRRHTGRYVCLADNGVGGQASKDHYLKVQFLPEVTVPKERFDIMPSQGIMAELVCVFKGYPDSITWHKGGQQPFPPTADGESSRFWKNRLIDEAEGTVTSMVTIANVKDGDYTGYTCMGKNDLGQSTPGSIILANPQSGNGQPPITDLPEPVLNLTACCISKGVRRQCLKACSFDLDLTAIAEHPTECLEDIDDMVTCGADGKNHTECCVQKKVPSECYPYCSGIVRPSADHLMCLAHIEVIVDCMEEGVVQIPSAPQNVKAKLTTKGYIQVWWDAPATNEGYVKQYVIYYKGGKDDDLQTMDVTYQNRRANVRGIHSFTLYTVYVVAKNHHGQSAPSNTEQVETYELQLTPPRNLIGHFLEEDERTIHLQWDAPAKNPGAVISYQVTYFVAGNPDDKTKVLTEKETLDIDNLSPGETYNFFVTAKTRHTETEESNTIAKTIPGVTVVAKKQSGVNKKIGMGIGISLLLIIIFIAAGVGAFMYYKMRVKVPHNRFEESVSFENPGYSKPGDVKISGLPSDPVYSEISKPETNGKLPMPQDEEAGTGGGAIMSEVATNAVDPYSNLQPRGSIDASAAPYATLDIAGTTDDHKAGV